MIQFQELGIKQQVCNFPDCKSLDHLNQQILINFKISEERATFQNHSATSYFMVKHYIKYILQCALNQLRDKFRNWHSLDTLLVSSSYFIPETSQETLFF